MAKGPKPEAEASSSGVTIADSVIAKIAHKACQEIAGVHALGGATSRALSSLRGGENRTQGVSVDMRLASRKLAGGGVSVFAMGVFAAPSIP